MELNIHFLFFSGYVFYTVVGINENVDLYSNEKNTKRFQNPENGAMVNQNFNYESLKQFGLGRKIIEDYRHLNPKLRYGFEHPQQLKLEAVTHRPYLEGPFHQIYQGRHGKGDIRVYNEKFDFDRNLERGQHVFFTKLVHCPISHLKAETDEGIPILLKGGVGYTHFTVIVKSHSGKRLKGLVQVYCKKPQVKMGYNYK